jgi:hypothetical protein
MIEDRLAILELTAAMGALVDGRNWEALEALFAARVTVDYSSLWGNGSATLSASELIGSWKALVPGFTRTQHTIGIPSIAIDGARAVATAPVIAHHFIDDPSVIGGRSWIVGGRYVWEIEKQDGVWQITTLTLAAAWQEGNADLPALAAQRAGNP